MFNYRTLYLSFGFEAINDNTGHTTRAEFMSAILQWMDADVRFVPAFNAWGIFASIGLLLSAMGWITWRKRQ